MLRRHPNSVGQLQCKSPYTRTQESAPLPTVSCLHTVAEGVHDVDGRQGLALIYSVTAWESRIVGQSAEDAQLAETAEAPGDKLSSSGAYA